jgi:hypothetical protein
MDLLPHSVKKWGIIPMKGGILGVQFDKVNDKDARNTENTGNS